MGTWAARAAASMSVLALECVSAPWHRGLRFSVFTFQSDLGALPPTDSWLLGAPWQIPRSHLLLGRGAGRRVRELDEGHVPAQGLFLWPGKNWAPHCSR